MKVRFIAAVAATLLGASSGNVSADDAAGVEFFENRIRPILAAHCYECHSADVPLKGGLRLDDRVGWVDGGDSGPAIVPGKPEDSLMIKALKYDGTEMPPKGRLPAAVVADFERWIQMGAPDPRERTAAKVTPAVSFEKASQFWSFVPPQKSAPPAVQQTDWPTNDIDRFILARLEGEGLSPSPPADRRTLIRRVTFDLVGLPPSDAEVEAFVNDPSATAFQTVVERLLESPHYGERWGRHWLDVARYAEDQAHTFKARNYPQGYRYRDWVVTALNNDMPYDRFVREQIAGDLIGPPDDLNRLAALGLFALGPVYYQDNGEQAKALADEWDDRVDTLTRGVLGLTVACSRCHDHKFDPISTADYYGLAGIFASSDYQERPIVPQEVLDRKALAEADVKSQQLALDRFLDGEARSIRPRLVTEIPQYFLATWKVLQRQKAQKDHKKLIARIAKEQKVSETLLPRWVEYLSTTEVNDQQPYLTEWRQWFANHQPQDSESANHDEQTAAVEQIAKGLQTAVESKLAQRESLFQEFGENVAFVKDSDRAVVAPGVIPLGNLFDDGNSVALHSALVSDKFGAAATEQSLGVERVAQGWGGETKIAADISFNFTNLGSDGRSHGAVVNDGWDTSGGIRTTGQSFPSNAARTEQGIGMHANALITFDLDEIRRAGLLPADTTFTFHVDRAGLNDDVFGSGGPSAHLAVIISRPHRKQDVFDAILSASVNGEVVKIAENDRAYYVASPVPPPMKADGRFAKFEIPVPAEARYVTLVATGAGMGAGDNTINSDHTVFSGARLEYAPASTPTLAANSTPQPTRTDAEQHQARRDAQLLSEFLSDQGLLALPGAEAESHLSDASKQQLGTLRTEFDRRKQLFDSILVPVVHSLSEGQGHDLKVYLQGNPTKQGDVAPRSMPVVFTHGTRLSFTSSGSGRAELAAAITSRENPLTARVIVNRVWQWHFGVGLVRTPSNFGRLGEPPTHPELLDHLAVGLMDANWSLKSLHRQIVSSATYQQASAYRPDAAEKDPENRLLWRMNRQRLEIEPWRDAMLAVTGELNPQVGGPSVDLASSSNTRRTMYGSVSRHQLNELLRLFDFPDANITSDRRSVTTVPLQQLFVLNSDFMAARAKALAARLNAIPNVEDQAKIRQVFRWVFARLPSDRELAIAQEFLQSATTTTDENNRLTPWEQYALALLGSNEFSYVD